MTYEQFMNFIGACYQADNSEETQEVNGNEFEEERKNGS